MWIVRLALRRPYTFVVLSILLLILGPITILRTPTDIFPNIDIPVVSIVWQYAGLSADQMSNRIVTLTERTLSTTVNNIEHVESTTVNGLAVVKIFLQPNASVDAATAQVTGACREQGMLVSVAGASVVRFAPPYIVTRDQLDEAVAILRGVLKTGAGNA